MAHVNEESEILLATDMQKISCTIHMHHFPHFNGLFPAEFGLASFYSISFLDQAFDRVPREVIRWAMRKLEVE